MFLSVRFSIHRLCIGCLVAVLLLSSFPLTVSSSEDFPLTSTTNEFPDESYVKDLLQRAHIPGMGIGIIDENQSVETYMFGTTNRQTNQKPTTNTVFFAGSLSKTVTATAIMQLFEQGKIDIDKEASTYLGFNLSHPQYPSVPITVRMLLTHTSGLSNVQWRLFYYFSLLHYPREWLRSYVQPDGFLYYEDNWNEYPPGEGIYYTSLGYELLGLIIERISGCSFEQYCKQHIFNPLSMKNTSFKLNDISPHQFTTLYGYLFGFYFPLPYYENHNDPAGGLYSTIEDISHFLLMHMNNGTYNDVSLLEPDNIKLMHTAQFTNLPGYDIYRDERKYGFGWIVWPDENQSYKNGLQGHLGNVPGGLSSMTIYNDTGVIFFGNEWFRVSYQQTFIMGQLRDYLHTKQYQSSVSLFKEP